MCLLEQNNLPKPDSEMEIGLANKRSGAVGTQQN